MPKDVSGVGRACNRAPCLTLYQCNQAFHYGEGDNYDQVIFIGLNYTKSGDLKPIDNRFKEFTSSVSVPLGSASTARPGHEVQSLHPDASASAIHSYQQTSSHLQRSNQIPQMNELKIVD